MTTLDIRIVDHVGYDVKNVRIVDHIGFDVQDAYIVTHTGFDVQDVYIVNRAGFDVQDIRIVTTRYGGGFGGYGVNTNAFSYKYPLWWLPIIPFLFIPGGIIYISAGNANGAETIASVLMLVGFIVGGIWLAKVCWKKRQ